MIVVIGSASYRPPDEAGPDGVGGLASRIAEAAVGAGATVEFVGKVGDDAVGDALVIALGRAGVGHAAVLRDAGHPTPILAARGVDADLTPAELEDDGPLGAAVLDEPAGSDDGGPTDRVLPEDPGARPRLDRADLDLALRYLAGLSVIVVADELDPGAAEVILAAASYSSAQVVAVVPAGDTVPGPLAGATVLEAPASDPDGAFGRLVGGYAAALDAGSSPADAFRAAVDRAGWEPAGP